MKTGGKQRERAMAKTQFDFHGSVAAITGAASGIGKRTSEALAEAGATVHLLDLDAENGEAVAAAIRAAGGTATYSQLNVTDAEAVDRTLNDIATTGGRLDILILSAGGYRRKYRIEETPLDEWGRVIALNLSGVFYCLRAAAPIFRRQRGGRIINLGSLAGLSSYGSASPPYTAAKAGVHALTRAMAYELGEYGVTVNVLAPSTTGTDRIFAVHTEERRAAIGAETRLGRIADVDEIVAWILFLASPEASYMTGKTLPVDGGRLMV